MAILYAAPFVLLAGVVFTVLSLAPRARRWAIPVPTGIVGVGVFALVGLGAVGFWINRPPLRPMGHGFLFPFLSAGALTGLVGGVLAWFIARWVASRLPAILLRFAVLVAGWCSYFVVLAALLLCAEYRFGLKDPGELGLVVLSLLALAAAWFISTTASEFRPRGRVEASHYS